MSDMEFPKTLLEHTDYQPLLDEGRATGRFSDDFTVPREHLDDAMVAALKGASEKAGDKSTYRVLDAIERARAGDTSKAIPRLKGAEEIILAFFRNNLQDGWVYRRGADGHLHAWLVTNVRYISPRSADDKPSISIDLAANSQVNKSGRRSDSRARATTNNSIVLNGEDVARRKVSDVLTNQGLFIETPALREAYDEGLEKYSQVLGEGFSEQYLFTGTPLDTENWKTDRIHRAGRKVIHDLARNEIVPSGRYMQSSVFSATGGDKVAKTAQAKKIVDESGEVEFGYGELPTQFGLRVFDLHSHDFLWVNVLDVERYVYDATLRDKIILPEDQRNLLDILTSDLGDYTGDVIEGKTTGNVVLAKGKPGVGKTLTAEVYSELIERPLYSIHSGNLGITADSVRENLETVFTRAKRWGTVTLLDEADVFVLERGDNLQQNAIVAEFLRTLEYFDGLLFMTTNRADEIDDAILSRAAAIIDYKAPGIDGIREVWKVQAATHGYKIDPGLLEQLVHGFADITPRDVKMLLRLALRVAKGHGVDLSTDIVAKAAMFRGLHFRLGSRVT